LSHDPVPPGQTETSPDDAPAAPARRRWFRPHTPLGWLVEAVLVLILGAGLLFVSLRVAPLTPEGRLFIQASVQGLKVGAYGRLHVDGLTGDLLSDARIRRLTIDDDKGPWLEADNLRIQWRYAELLSRRLHLTDVAADRVLILRPPIPKPDNKPPGKPPAFSYALDAIRTRLETAPAFSGQRGLYTVDGALDIEDRAGTTARLNAVSLLRVGDHLRLGLSLGRGRAVKVDADALEARGGGIAGSLGLTPDQPFSLIARLSGTLDTGQMAIVARSGATVPIDASGGWTPDGGSVKAHVLLDASHWTRSLVTRFGPEADVAIVGKQTQGAIYDLDARFVAANMVLTARGPFDMARRVSQGMAATALVADLKKLTPAPSMGAGRASGTLKGNLADLAFAGTAEADDLQLWGWRLDHAAGPVKVTWKKGELDVQAMATGAGGSGTGVLALAGGAAPVATADVMRLKDGRILIKSMDIVGKGVKIHGSGGQTLLLHGLTFSGQAQAADLGQTLPGASGALDLSWTASQEAGPDRPWVFTAEGSGSRLASGAGEIDRLMGAEPKLSLAASYQNGAFTVSRASLEGAKETASAQGRWALAGDLDFNLDWRAQGPFGLGPLAIDGEAKGGGRITGQIGAPKAELSADVASIAFPELTVTAARLDLTFQGGKDGSDGTVALAGQSIYGPARARSAFRFLPGGIDLTAIDADAAGVKAQGALSLRDGSPSSADLTVAVGPGALLGEGQAQGVVRIGQTGAAAARADIDLTAKGAVLRDQPLALASAHIKADGPLAHLPYRITADGAWLRTPVQIDGSGVLSRSARGFDALFNGSGTLRRAPFKTLEPVQLRLEPGDRFARLRLSLGGGRAELDASQAHGKLGLNADLTGVDLSFLSEDFTGRFDAQIALQGQGSDLRGTLNGALKDARSRDARKGLSINGDVKATLAAGQIAILAKLDGAQGLASTLDVSLPAQASASPFRLGLTRTGPMRGTFVADGEIQPLWDLFLGGERTLGGRLTAKAELGGTPADPRVTGRVDLVNGLFDDYATGLKLRDLTLGAALNTDAVSLERFLATDGQKGKVTGAGQVSLARGGGGNLTLDLTAFRLIDNDTAQADASGRVKVDRGADGKAKITGKLDLVKGEINAAARTGPNIVAMDVIEKNKPFRIDDQAPPPPGAGAGQAQTTGAVDLDIALRAPRGILIKGRGLNLDMAIDAHVSGSTGKPVLDGEARVVRGDYDFSGKRFTFDNRGTVRLSNDPAQIRLDLTATREDPSLTAVIRIQGTAIKPQITLTSTPVLPNDEVLSQVLFGASAAQLSPLEAAQLASALTALASGGGFDVVGGLRSFARLDRLALVGGTAATGVSVAGGKYLADNVYVEVAGGGRTGPSVQVEYRVTRNLSIISKLATQTTTTIGGVTTQGGSELSVRWRHDFKTKPPRAKK
jgi:translocation and assembly module TamB